MLTPVPVNASRTAPKKPQLWHASAGSLSYYDAENRAHLEQNVVVQSAEHRMRVDARLPIGPDGDIADERRNLDLLADLD